MIFLTQDLASLEPYNKDTLSLYSRCGVGDFLILRDYAIPNAESKGFEKCEHCGSFTSPGNVPIFRDNKKYLHIRLLKNSLDARIGQMPDYLHEFVIPFLEKIFPTNCNIFISLALNPNRQSCGGFIGDEVYYEGFANTPNVLASDIFPTLSHQDLTPEIFDQIHLSEQITEFVKTEYICIHTRYRSADPPDEDFFRSLLFDVIGSCTQKVCIVGEKTHSCDFFSIYDICKDSIPQDRFTDFATDDFNINNLATDCFISKHAKLCLAFGIGGNVVMNSYSRAATHTFTDLGADHPFFSNNNLITMYNNKYSFMLKVSQLLNSH